MFLVCLAPLPECKFLERNDLINLIQLGWIKGTLEVREVERKATCHRSHRYLSRR